MVGTNLNNTTYHKVVESHVSSLRYGHLYAIFPRSSAEIVSGSGEVDKPNLLFLETYWVIVDA